MPRVIEASSVLTEHHGIALYGRALPSAGFLRPLRILALILEAPGYERHDPHEEQPCPERSHDALHPSRRSRSAYDRATSREGAGGLACASVKKCRMQRQR